jgi:hypothetical protein
MTRSSFVLVALLLSVVGCSQDPVPYFHVSESFSDEQFDVINGETGHLCELSSGASCPIVTRGKAPSTINRKQLSQYGAEGVQYEKDGAFVIELDVDLDLDALRLVVRHELGHAMGCGHHLPEGNVMAESRWKQGKDWTDADLECMH